MKAFCSWCGNEFEASARSHIYCSVPCRTDANKEKKNERLRIKRINKRVGKVRLCPGCGNPLSIYNEAGLCDNCIIPPKELKSLMKDLKGLFDFED